jgi:hypothetical protein
VVLEAAREGALAGREQGRADRVALERSDVLAVEAEGELAVALDALAALLGQSGHTP